MERTRTRIALVGDAKVVNHALFGRAAEINLPSLNFTARRHPRPYRDLRKSPTRRARGFAGWSG
jgi:hypothetical protein